MQSICINDKQTKPIILLVHVPESKIEIPNRIFIIYQIYFFLSIICDISVVVLNKEHYTDQIDLINRFQFVKDTYTNYEANLAKMKNQNNIQIQENEVYSSDGDEDLFKDEYEIQEKERYETLCKNSIFNGINPSFLQKEPKYICLLNDEDIQDNEIIDDKNQLLNRIKNQINIKYCQVQYINTEYSITYNNFLTTLIHIAKEVKTDYNQILYRLKLTQLCNVNNALFIIRIENFNSDIKYLIYSRLNQLLNMKLKMNYPFAILDYFSQEINIIKSYFEAKFLNTCNNIIDIIKEKLIVNNKENVQQLLISSSEKNLNYINEFITSQSFLSNETKDLIKTNHIRFLKNEFLSIIQEFYSESENKLNAYKINLSILESQIQNDRIIIKQMLNNYNLKISSLNERKTLDIMDQMKKGTDDVIRETENVREIKVMVEAGHLEDEIDQDF